MAGGLTISTLNDSSGVLATQNGMSGVAKAWVNFNGTSGATSIRASFNVSSVTRNATGDYSVTFTTAMPDANYSIVETHSKSTGGGDIDSCLLHTYNANLTGTQAPTTTTFRFLLTQSGSGPQDTAYVNLGVFR